MIKLPEAFATALLLALPLAVSGEPIGEVDTAFKLIGPDHKIVVERELLIGGEPAHRTAQATARLGRADSR